MRHVLVEGHFHREPQRIPTTVDRSLRTEGGLDDGGAFAYVLLPLDLDDLVFQLDHIDHLGPLHLTHHLGQSVATTPTNFIGGVQGAANLHARQIRLLCRAVPGLGLAWFGIARRFVAGLPGHGVKTRRLLLRHLQHRQHQLQLAAAAF